MKSKLIIHTNRPSRKFFAIFASMGIFGILLSLAIFGAIVYTWGTGVVFGFHHSVILGLVSILPPVGFFEGLLHLIGLI